MKFETIWKDNVAYRYFSVAVVIIFILYLDNISGTSSFFEFYDLVMDLQIFILPPVWIIWTILLFKQRENLNNSSDPTTYASEDHSTAIFSKNIMPSVLKNMVRMFWYPFQTLEYVRQFLSLNIFPQLFLVSLLPALGVLVMGGLSAMIFSFVFSCIFIIIVSSFIHQLAKILGGKARYRQTIIGLIFSLIPFYSGLLVIGLTVKVSTILALIVLWPTLTLSLINMWWMYKHYQELYGLRLFLAVLLSLFGITILCFFVTLMWASTART